MPVDVVRPFSAMMGVRCVTSVVPCTGSSGLLPDAANGLYN
jgi:hypothetical protein